MSTMRNQQKSELITIEDSKENPGENILKYLLEQNDELNNYEVFCFEKFPSVWTKILQCKINCTNYINPSICKEIDVIKMSFLEKSIIIIDSINQMSALMGWKKSLQLISELAKKKCVVKIINIVHNDCLLYGKLMTNHLKYISHTYIAVMDVQIEQQYHISVCNKKSGGKVTQKMQLVYFDNSEMIWKNSVIKSEMLNKKPEKAIVPHSLASFKISIDDSAKSTKDDLILPYTELSTRSQVLYEQDAADDWDDEDPDDDLDI